ncbi:GNAT family N-acetyltransferase [Thalassomonas haliotis]|uniref:GNAT family N-acetyltransferase n=1 Tax=Thalassomonas haliotis TaxID=485448 RepID=A0ABY7VJU8_9GAMM|nr:GNAT family N-acetyltransferase [Thalassomonas haliotis]WDE13861.1 GNAT family N-acetyltransferase [Thalassomonas haliotis]
MAEQTLVTINQDTCFTSERLFFRPLTAQDKTLYLSLYCNEQVMRYIAPPFSPEQIQQLFSFTLNNSNSLGDKRLTWAVIDDQTGEKRGIVAFTWDLALPHAASIGIMLCPDSQGKGYGLEAQAALTQYGFSCLCLNRIHAQFATTNQASENIYHKLGFITEGKKTGFVSPDNGLETKHFCLNKQDWQHRYIKNLPG